MGDTLQKANSNGVDGTIAYLVSQYPAPSHTFIRREIDQLRSMGVNIRTYSIRIPPPGLDDASDMAAKQTTFYVLRQSFLTYFVAHLATFTGSPLRYLALLGLAVGHRVPGVRAFVWSLFHFAESIVLARQLRRDGIVALHNHFANSAATVGMLATAFLQIPWSLTLHGISETDYPAGPLLSRKIEAAKFVACVSLFGRAQAMRITSPSHWPKLQIVRCGIDLKALPAAKRTSFENPTQIICVGRLSAEKGHLGLLEAFSGVRTQGFDAQLVLVGDGPEQSMIESCARDLGVESRVIFAGRKSEIDTLAAIADADLLVVPSFMEGLPVVLMEAMALGVPVIASRVAGVPELVEHGINGLLFHPSDWTGLANAMVQMLSNVDASKTMAGRARETVSAEFDIALSARRLSTLFATAGLSNDGATVSSGRIIGHVAHSKTNARGEWF